MLSKTHRMLIEEAARGAPWAEKNLPNLLRGCDDEDVLIVPWVGWRLPAAGLTHTTRPGHSRGELGATSSAHKADALWRARRCVQTSDGRCQCAQWIGRIAHLLGDAAVPARAKGVWHLLGDPLELWLEAHLTKIRPPQAPQNLPQARTAGDLVRQMAHHAAMFQADTTRTPWGWWAYARWGRGVCLSAQEVEAQGRVLVALAVRYTGVLLRMWDAGCGGGARVDRGSLNVWP